MRARNKHRKSTWRSAHQNSLCLDARKKNFGFTKLVKYVRAIVAVQFPTKTMKQVEAKILCCCASYL